MWRSTAHFPAQGLRKRASLSNCLTLACRLGFREYGCLRMGLKCRICKELLLCFWIQTCENMTQRFMACPEVNVRAWTRAPEIDACSHFAPQRCVFTPHRAAASDSPNGNLLAQPLGGPLAELSWADGAPEMRSSCGQLLGAADSTPCVLFYWNHYFLCTFLLKSLLFLYWHLYFLFTFLLKSLLFRIFFPIEISIFSLLFYWNLHFLCTFLFKSLLSLYFSCEISTFSLLFFWNLHFLCTFLFRSDKAPHCDR